jgi:5-methyltetrahydropteroyltriglutamate--homocysteine methyltransferase
MPDATKSEISIIGRDFSKMSSLPAQITGIFARPKNLIQATRDFDRRRLTDQELEQVRQAAVKEIIALQEGFEYVTDGNLLWQDLFRPFTKGVGIVAGPLTRFFETNTFFRRPIILQPLKFRPREIDKFFYFELLPHNRKVILPGPFTFLHLSENRYYKKDFIIAIAKMLKGVVRHLVQKGVMAIQFSEPYIAYFGKNLTKHKLANAKRAYQIIAEGKGKAEIILATYFGDFSPVTQLLEFPVDSIVIDLTSTSVKNLRFKTTKKIGLGCIDATNSLLENPKVTIKLVNDLIKRLKLKRFFICPNCDLDFLPYSVAEKKTAILRAVAYEFKS